jgi:hypothetical protein
MKCLKMVLLAVVIAPLFGACNFNLTANDGPADQTGDGYAITNFPTTGVTTSPPDCPCPSAAPSYNGGGGVNCNCGINPPNQQQWTSIQQSAVCPNLPNQDCLGFYGFTVNQDGSYQVGPTDLGVMVGGELTSEELAVVNSDLQAVFNTGDGAITNCGSAIPAGGVSITEVSASGSSSLVEAQYDVPGSYCWEGSEIAITRLILDLGRMLQEYYPNPFPAPAQN